MTVAGLSNMLENKIYRPLRCDGGKLGGRTRSFRVALIQDLRLLDAAFETSTRINLEAYVNYQQRAEDPGQNSVDAPASL